MSIYVKISSYLLALFISYKFRALIGNYFHKKHNKVIAFGEQQTNIALLFSAETDARKRSLNQLLVTLSSAEHSLDVCVYTLSMSDLIESCLESHRNGVRVRVMTNGGPTDSTRDGGESLAHKRKIKKLMNAGIDVRIVRLKLGYMHNKFAIVDQKLLINGSLNWTKTAVYNNYEDIIITSDTQLVSLYLNQFNQYWTELSHQM